MKHFGYVTIIFILACCCVSGIAEETKAPLSLKEQAEQYPISSVVYKTHPQAELALEIRKPSDWKVDDQRPAILFFFGGGWRSGSVKQFAPQAAYFAQRGMVTFCAEYRIKSKHGVAPESCVQDAKSAMRYLRSHAKELGVNPEKIVVSGGSAGGHLALSCAFIDDVNDPDDDLSISTMPNLLIAYNPVTNTVDGDRVTGKFPTKEKAQEISPRHHLRDDCPPLLLLMGSQDFLYDTSMDFIAELGRRHTTIELYIAKDEKHGFFNRSPWLEKTTQRADEFLVSLGYLEEKRS